MTRRPTRRVSRPLAVGIAVLAIAGAAGVVLAVGTPTTTSATVLEDATDATITLQASSTNLAATSATVAITTSPTNGTIEEGTTASMTCNNGTCTGDIHYTPNADYTGTGADSFAYTVDDGDGASAPQTVTIDITPVNEAPSFTAGGDQTVLEDSGPQTVGAWASGMSAGPPNESTQTLDFILSSDTNAALFAVAPAVDATTGDLTFTPADNANGSATVGFELHDSGGTDNGGVNTSAEQTFTINVTAVNDPPTFSNAGGVTVLEDSAAYSAGWASSISPGPSDESGQTVSFSVTGNSNAALFSVAPAVASDGTLTFTLAANANGSATMTVKAKDDGGTLNGGNDTSSGASLTITATAVNDPPTFSNNGAVEVNEDSGAYSAAWATSISPGPSNESSQTVSFSVTGNSNAALFSVAPAVAANGTLTFTPAANANGSATMTVTAKDNGGTSNGGNDSSTGASLTITVDAVNDPPTFSNAGAVTVLEDSGAHSATWASSISPGPSNESTQTVGFSVSSNSNAALFSVAPAVAANGTLTFTPAANANGSATMTVTAQDNGGTANGGHDSTAVSLTINVTAVNDPPTFSNAGAVTVLEDSGAHSAGWASSILPGPSNESTQTLAFSVSGNTNAALFSVAPAVATNGTLTFTPAANANGSATMTITATDNGGTANGGHNTSAVSLTINVTAVNDPPSFTKGPDEVVNHDSGAFSMLAWATAISTGPSNESTQTVSFSFTADDNTALFSVLPAVSSNGTLTFTVAAGKTGTAHLTVQAQDSGGTTNGGNNLSAPLSFTVRVNANPNAVNDNATVAENAAATTIDVLANDTSLPDPPEVLTVTGVSNDTTNGPLHGIAAVGPAGANVTYKPTAGYYGSDFFRYTIADPYGGTDFATVFVTITKDTTPPTTTLPVEGIKTVSTMTSTSLSGVLTWSGTDAGVGIQRYELQRSVNGAAFASITLPTLKTTSIPIGLSPTASYQFRVRAIDLNGNVGAWSTGPKFVQARYQETSGYLTYSTGWLPTSNTSDSGGGAKYASVLNKTVSFTHVMRDVAFVGPRSSTRGSFDVYVDGVKVGAAAMKATTTAYQQVVWQYHFAKIGTHTIKIVLRGNGRVDLDCFVILT